MAINILQTIANTFDKVNGYTYAKFGEGKDMVIIDVRHGKNDLLVKENGPTSVRIVRPDSSIHLYVNEETSENKPILVMGIEAHDKKYGDYKTTFATNGVTTTIGNEKALENCQNDAIISDYISFVDSESSIEEPKKSKWNIVRDMQASR